MTPQTSFRENILVATERMIQVWNGVLLKQYQELADRRAWDVCMCVCAVLGLESFPEGEAVDATDEQKICGSKVDEAERINALAIMYHSRARRDVHRSWVEGERSGAVDIKQSAFE